MPEGIDDLCLAAIYDPINITVSGMPISGGDLQGL